MVAQLGEKYEVGGRKCFFLFILLIDAVDLLLVVVVVGCWGWQLPLKASHSGPRGWYITLMAKDMPDRLPAVFEQVTQQRKTVSMTTSDLRKLNDRLEESSVEMYLRSEM
jgi:hypothetical protein